MVPAPGGLMFSAGLEIKLGRKCVPWTDPRFLLCLAEVRCRARPHADQGAPGADRIDRYRAAFRRERLALRVAPAFLETIVPGLMYRRAFRPAGEACIPDQDGHEERRHLAAKRVGGGRPARWSGHNSGCPGWGHPRAH